MDEQITAINEDKEFLGRCLSNTIMVCDKKLIVVFNSGIAIEVEG